MLKGRMTKMSPLHIRMNGDGIILIIAKICIMKWKSQTQPYPLAPVNPQTCKIRTQFTQIAKNSYEAKSCVLYFYGLFKLSLSSISNWRDINETYLFKWTLCVNWNVNCAMCAVHLLWREKDLEPSPALMFQSAKGNPIPVRRMQTFLPEYWQQGSNPSM